MELTRQNLWQIEQCLAAAQLGQNCLVSPKLAAAIAKDERFDGRRGHIKRAPTNGQFSGHQIKMAVIDEYYPAPGAMKSQNSDST